MNDNATKRWALSLHSCSQLVRDLTTVRDDLSEHPTHRKEEPKAVSRLTSLIEGSYENIPVRNAADYGWLADHVTETLLPVSLPAVTIPAPAPVLSLLYCTCSTNDPCSSRKCACRRSGMACSFVLQLPHHAYCKL